MHPAAIARNPPVTQPVFRFAPSPNGRLHLGHAYSALLNAHLAARLRGRFLLRIEDIDVTRCRPDLESGVLEDLAWLGLRWEQPVRRQSEHFDEYRARAAHLRDGGLLYPCFCTRKDIADQVTRIERERGGGWPRDPDGSPLYPGTCRALPAAVAKRRIAAGEPCAWRLALDTALEIVPGPRRYRRFSPTGEESSVQARPEVWGDAVIVRKEIPTSYHLSVVADDALQGVTHVVRGTDLEAATDLHVLLQALLGLATPLYHHHGLIRDPAGDKLSKSLGSETLRDLRKRGVTPATIRERLGFAAGGTPA
jgi:glutamyl-Q tRNA(Asp) synthetase